MKTFAAIATIAMIAISRPAAAQLETKIFMEEPADIQSAPQVLGGPNDEPVFKIFPGYKLDPSAVLNKTAVTVNATTTAVATTSHGARDLQAAAVAVAVFQIAAAAVPILASIIQNHKKECQQLACWISTNSKICALAVAEKVQSDITKGRDRYAYESIQTNGMWVRYWRTQFEPADRGNVVSGKCTNGSPFTVTNCQSTGRVYC